MFCQFTSALIVRATADAFKKSLWDQAYSGSASITSIFRDRKRFCVRSIKTRPTRDYGIAVGLLPGLKVENSPAKGDYHAREVFGLCDHGRRDGDGHRRRHDSVYRSLVGAGRGGLRHDTGAVKTPWGEPDLQGIWTDETQTSLQRPARYANQEFFTPEQRAKLDNLRADILSRERRGQRGTEADVAGAYNSAFVTMKHIGARTSLIVDPPNGRLPALTAEAQRNAAADRAFRLALLQATETCREKSGGCAGGTYDPKPSPRRAERPPRYNTIRINCHDGPEDASLAERCLTLGLPEFGGSTSSFRRIVQTPGGITMFYDVGQGQGWQRNIVMNGSPHLPAASANGTATPAATGRAIPW